jgi:hypothetical protein
MAMDINLAFGYDEDVSKHRTRLWGEPSWRDCHSMRLVRGMSHVHAAPVE